VLHVHVWGNPEWFGEFYELTAGFASCSSGDEVDPKTQILVKGRPDPSDLERAPLTHAIIVPFAGIPPATRDLVASRPGLSLYNLHHNSADTAEMAIALYMAAAKRLIPRDRELRKGLWSSDSFVHGGEESESVRAAGKTALVLGYGAIGQRIGKICEAMEMDVWGIRRSGPFTDRIRPTEDLDGLLAKAEALFVALPLTPETDGLMTPARIAMLPSGAIISNIARGAIFHEEALFMALRDGKVGAAGLDVWWTYPKDDAPTLPSKFPFQDLENVVMTPHVGGSSDASENHRMRYLANLILEISEGTAKAASTELGY
jgi:phosphoglycerate dehydrogenase-like enzyme